MWSLLYLVLPFASVVWAMFNIKGIKALQRKLQLIVIMALAVFFFYTQDYVIDTGYYPFYGAKFMHDLAGTMLIPLIHLFYCYGLGIEHELRFFRIMMCLIVLMVPEFCVVLSRPYDTAPPIDACFNYLQFDVGNGHTFRLQMYALIIFAQGLIEMQRIFVLRRIFIVRELYLTREGKAVVWGSIGVCVWILLSLLPSHDMVQRYNCMDAIMAVYSVIAPGLVYLTVKYLTSDIIVDGDKRPVNITADADDALADSIRVAITRDRVYLNNTLRIEDFAASLSTNRTYVARVCRLRYRMTFTELMNHYRVEHAKLLMINNPRNRMDEIAAESGFSSASFFARVFKAHEGVTPTQWRLANSGAAQD